MNDKATVYGLGLLTVTCPYYSNGNAAVMKISVFVMPNISVTNSGNQSNNLGIFEIWRSYMTNSSQFVSAFYRILLGNEMFTHWRYKQVTYCSDSSPADFSHSSAAMPFFPPRPGTLRDYRYSISELSSVRFMRPFQINSKSDWSWHKVEQSCKTMPPGEIQKFNLWLRNSMRSIRNQRPLCNDSWKA